MTVLVWVPTKVQPVEDLDAVAAQVEPGGTLVLFGSGDEPPLRAFPRGEWLRAEVDAHDGRPPTVLEPLLT